MTVSASRQKLLSKVDALHQGENPENPSPIAGMKDLLKNYVSTRRKKSLGFVPARKSVSTTRNEAFAEKYVSTIRKNCFFWQTKKRFPPAGKIFSVKIDSA